MLGCEAMVEAVEAALAALKEKAAKADEKSAGGEGGGEKPAVGNAEGDEDEDAEKEKLKNRVAKLEADGREEAAAEREAQRREEQKRRVVEALKGEAERRRGEEARTAEEERRRRAEETQRQREEELARRGEERLRRQMAEDGVATGFQARLHAAYTAEVARRARPPEIHVDRRIPRSYLTEDGKKLFIGADARRPEDLDGVLDDFGTKLEAGRRFDVERRLQWRRERMMLGAKPIRGEHTWEEDARAVNPNLLFGKEFRENCPQCAVAYIARTRGMDVRAAPIPNGAHEEAASSVLAHNPAAGFKGVSGGRFFAHGGFADKRAIEALMMQYGDGAQALIRIRWEGAETTHVFIAEQHGGETLFIL